MTTGPAGGEPDVSHDRRPSLLRDLVRADLVFAVALFVLFVLALLTSTQWSFRTALFPRIVTTAGCAFTALLVVTLVVTTLRARRRPTHGGSTVSTSAVGEHTEEDEEREHEMEYVYATAGSRAWAAALGWVALYIGLLWLAGLFVASAVFCLAYLRFGADRTWRFAAVYAFVMTGVLYVALGVLLPISVPDGIVG